MNRSKVEDDQLLALVKNGDDIAFREIYIRYWKDLFLTAHRKLRHKQLCEELIQNIFTGLWKRKDTLQIENLEAYLHTALKYQVINHFRSRLAHASELDPETVMQQPSSNNAEERVMEHDLQAAIEKGVALLPGKTQEVFVHSRFEHLTVKEISGRMHISEKAVEYHITRSLKMLRLHLREFIGIFILFFFRA